MKHGRRHPRFKIHHNREYKDYTVYWGPFDEDDNKKIAKWCKEVFGNNWENGIEDLHWVRLTSKKDLTAFLLKWSY